MKHFYYAENDLQLGPFTIEELKTKRLKKSTLVWTDGMKDWATAESISELKEILVSEPPPLPKKNYLSQPNEKVKVKQEPTSKGNTKFDPTYKKETEATVFGFILLIIPIILNLTGAITLERTTLAVVALILRIIVTIVVINIATRQNRNSIGWGWFAFFFPSIALIIIGLLKKLRLKIELDGSLTISSQINILLEKANRLFSSARYSECIEVLNKAIEIDNKNLDCIRLRGLAHYHLKNLDSAKSDFEMLINSKAFFSEAFYYLGNIEIQKLNREKAISFWQKAIEQKSEKAQIKLDLYYTFTGEYLLGNSQITKKLTSNHKIDFEVLNYTGGFDEIDLSENLTKLRTELKGYENGLAIELRKTFKSYQFAIAFYEIADIVYNKNEREIELVLTDKKMLKFKYSKSTNEFDQGLKDFCIMYKAKIGKNPTALSNWKD